MQPLKNGISWIKKCGFKVKTTEINKEIHNA
jgi:hypothetical protein